MRDTEEQHLIEKLRKVEALFARPATAGERGAAEGARDRIRERLRGLASVAAPVEFRFTLLDDWSTSLFVALLRRYGSSPYRYRGQRRTTVMVRLNQAFVDEILWPEFQQFEALLREHLESVTRRVIAQATGQDDSAVEVRPEGDATQRG